MPDSLPNLIGFLAKYAPADADVRYVDVPAAGSDDARLRPVFLVIRCGDRAVVVNPLDTGGHLSVDVHAFVGEEAHDARVVGFTRDGRATHIPGDLRGAYPLTAVVVGDNRPG